MKETIIWSGSPSQWSNVLPICANLILASIITYLAIVLKEPLVFLGYLVPIYKIIMRFLVVNSWKVEITSERIIEHTGVLNRITDELEIYRVKDIREEQPILLRMFGLSNLILVTSDSTDSIMTIPAITDVKEIREKLRELVEMRRDQKGVREVDFDRQ